MFLTIEVICGVCVGFEIVSKKELNEGKGWYVLIELGIIRIIIDK